MRIGAFRKIGIVTSGICGCLAICMASCCAAELRVERRKPLTAAVGSAAEDYIPDPQPVRSEIEISAYYYPGTEHMPEWDMVRQTLPRVRPLLGWYDEGDPENIDWQIKWAVEHGISSFCVDWYWDRGVQRLDHWVKGFYKARFRQYLKWYVMYANHNAPGAHSMADQAAVSRWWIEHYFKTPEYYKIDGKPVVVYFSMDRVDRDFIAEAARQGETLTPGEGLRRALAITERMVREAGFPGVHWMGVATDLKVSRESASRWRMAGIRNIMPYTFGGGLLYDISPEARQPGDTRQRLSFELMMAGAEKFWAGNVGLTPGIDYVPLLPTGWDDRPRSFQKADVTTGRTPEKFRRACESARAFCRKRGIRRVMLSPVNEWQEGSYIEPNDEYGFGMYDALRDVFCEKPPEGWPKNLTPADVGRPLREFPPMSLSRVQSWTFDKDTEGWYRQPYGCPVALCRNGALAFITTRKDNFNVRLRLEPFDAGEYRTFRLRLRLTPVPGTAPIPPEAARMRLKWGTAERPVIDGSLVVDDTRAVAVCAVTPDGAWHEQLLGLDGNPDWCGEVNELWLEAIGAVNVNAEIDWMRFE